MSRIYAPNLLTESDATDDYAMRNTQLASSKSTSAEKASFHQSLTTWCCFHLGSSLNSAVLKISKSSIFQVWLTFPQAWFPSPTLGNCRHVKMDTFGKSVYFRAYKMALRVPKRNFVLSVFHFLANFEIWYLLCHFSAVFPLCISTPQQKLFAIYR